MTAGQRRASAPIAPVGPIPSGALGANGRRSAGGVYFFASGAASLKRRSSSAFTPLAMLPMPTGTGRSHRRAIAGIYSGFTTPEPNPDDFMPVLPELLGFDPFGAN